MAEKMTKADAIKLMRLALKDTEGLGHSLRYGAPPRFRYNSETGERYLTNPTPACLECSDTMMRSIWSVWEKLPQIVRALDEATHDQ